MTNTIEISAAGREDAERADSIICARVNQIMAERIGARIGRTDITARVMSNWGRIILCWQGPVVQPLTDEDVAARRRVKAECAALVEALEAAGYTVTGSETTNLSLNWRESRRDAFIAVAITPQG